MEVPLLSKVFTVLWDCNLAWFYVYGSWKYLAELLSCAIPFAIVFSLVLFIVLHVLRIPPPAASIVTEVLGVDPWYVDESKLTDDDGYFMACCAHRGAALDAPENSLTAFKKAKEKGCTAVEFDIALTKDNVPIVFHDPDVNRLCDATGAIKDMTWKELQELDISSKHPLRERFIGEKIASFDEAIETCLKLGQRMFLDLKGSDLKIIPYILEAFKTHEELYKRAIVSSFNPILIYLIRRANPQIIGSIAWRPSFFTHINYTGLRGAERPRFSNPIIHVAAQFFDSFNTWALNHLLYYVLGISTILLIKDEVTANVALRWHNRGIRPIAWTVNLPIEKQYFRRILKVTFMTDTLES